LVRRFQTKVAGAWLRGEVAGQGYIISHYTQLRATMEKALRTYGFGNAAPMKSPLSYFKTTEPEASDNRIIFSPDESAAPYVRCTHKPRETFLLTYLLSVCLDLDWVRHDMTLALET
jgi:hypothetical protein